MNIPSYGFAAVAAICGVVGSLGLTALPVGAAGYGSPPVPTTVSANCPEQGTPVPGFEIVGLATSVVGSCTQVFATDSFGDLDPGNSGVLHLNAPVVGIAAASDGSGCWTVGADGGVFTSGSAPFLGSAATLHLNAPIVGIAATPDNKGYYLAAADGGVFTYGDAQFQGSMGGVHLNAPIVGISVDPQTSGYRLTAADGGVFSFNAPFLGSVSNLRLNGPIVGIATDTATGGYWLAGADGGIFAFHAAPSIGETGQSGGDSVTAIAGGSNTYWIGTANGRIVQSVLETP